MSLDTYGALASSVQARCSIAGPMLARQWISWAFRRLCEKRRWSYLTKYGQFVFPTAYTTGTVAVTNNSATVLGTSTVWTAAHETLQFRSGNQLYTVATVVSNTELTLDLPWGGDTLTGQSYSIRAAYRTAPSDFHSFITAVDPSRRWRLWLNNLTQTDIDYFDAQRTRSGPPYVIAFRDYDTVSSPPLPRYEIWPHQTTAGSIRYLYETRPTDLGDSGATLPRFIRGDVLMEGALWQAALWPGPEGRKNPMFNLDLANRHRLQFEQFVAELERQDDEVWEQDLDYADWWKLPLAPWPFPVDASYIQQHAI